MSAIVEVAPGAQTRRHFVSYTGLALPFRLVGPIEEAELANRNTYICAWYDAADRLVGFDKLVYGEVELSHRYTYSEDGRLERTRITMCGEAPVEVIAGQTPCP